MHDNSSAKPLDLSKPVQTRDGRKVRILCTDRKGHEYPVIALVDSKQGEALETYTPEGVARIGCRSSSDLVNVPECLYVLMARHHSGLLGRWTFLDRATAEKHKVAASVEGYTAFSISELTIHI